MPDHKVDPHIDVALGVLGNEFNPTHPVRITHASLVIQSSGVDLPYGGEKMAAFRAAQTAAEIVEVRGSEPGDFSE